MQRAGGGEVEIRAPRHGSERSVYLADELVRLLAQHVEQYRPGTDPARWIFAATPGQPPHQSGLLQPAPVRTGQSGALEKPYRSTAQSWWLDNPLGSEPPDVQMSPIIAFQEELAEAGPESVATSSRFTLHLSPDDITELDRRILAVLDQYVETDEQRRDQPAYGGIVVVHRLAR